MRRQGGTCCQSSHPPTDLKHFVRFSAKYRGRVDALQAVLGGDSSIQSGPVGGGVGGGGAVGVGVKVGIGGSGVAVTTSLLPIDHHPADATGAAAVSSDDGSRRHDFESFRILPL